jgi:hypothetical protein
MNLQVLDPSNPLWLETLQTLRHDVFHLPDYMTLEARRLHAVPEAVLLTQGDCVFFLPYLLRQCSFGLDGEAIPNLEDVPDLFDVVSPNGYAGILLNQAAAGQSDFLATAMQQVLQIFSDRAICSAFLRLHPILNQGFQEIYQSQDCMATIETIVIDLTLPEAELRRQTRRNFCDILKKRHREGFTARMVPFQDYVDVFSSIYEETMERVGASKVSYFGHDYFCQLANQLGDYLQLCIVEFEHQITCAGLFTECCGIVQHHLNGTRTQFLKQSPNILLNDCARFWAKERGNEVLHLGGGVGGKKDNLYHFKIGFSPITQLLPVLHLITNQSVYTQLTELRAKALKIPVEQLLKTGFFPAYRSPAPVEQQLEFK